MGGVMPALNFQAQFTDAVENGLAELQGEPLPHPGVEPKTQTIRALRKDGRDPQVGDTLYLFTGMRTKKCRKLGEVQCSLVQEVLIKRTDSPLVIVGRGASCGVLLRNGLRKFAQADGFATIDEMLTWFEKTHGLPFTGKLYRWVWE